MPDLDSAQSLLRAARRDAAALAAMVDSKPVADEVFGFLVQQAIEKALKAWISLLDLTYPFSHDLTALLNILDAAGADVDELVPLTLYNPFAVELRYNELPDDDPPLDREGALEQVESLLTEVESLYSTAIHSE